MLNPEEPLTLTILKPVITTYYAAKPTKHASFSPIFSASLWGCSKNSSREAAEWQRLDVNRSRSAKGGIEQSLPSEDGVPYPSHEFNIIIDLFRKTNDTACIYL